MPRKSYKESLVTSTRIFVIEGKNDYLIIAVVMLLLAFFLVGGFFLR